MRILSCMRTNSPKNLLHGKRSTWDTANVLLEESITQGPIDFKAIFGNTRPVEIEIGTGKGTFLLERAQARPEVNFLGIEYAKAYCCYAADRFRRHGLTNVRMLHADAGDFFKACVPAKSLLRVHIYFPDPWPKRRHHRRRLFQPSFLAEVRRVLRIGGELIIVTDHMGYFNQVRNVLASSGEGFATVPMPRMTDVEGEIVGTNFERKYIAEGRPFYSATRLKYR